MKKITKTMTFMEIMQNYPEAAEVLINEGMHCLGCGMAAYETLEEGCLAHGLNVEEIVAKINKKINKGKKK